MPVKSVHDTAGFILYVVTIHGQVCGENMWCIVSQTVEIYVQDDSVSCAGVDAISTWEVTVAVIRIIVVSH